MRRTFASVLVLAALFLSGCTGPADHPRVSGLFEFTSGSYDQAAGLYNLDVRAQVEVPLSGDARDVRLDLGVVPSCGQTPREWGTLVLGNLAAGGSTNVRDATSVTALQFDAPQLSYRLTLGKSNGDGSIADKGCGPLRENV